MSQFAHLEDAAAAKALINIAKDSLSFPEYVGSSWEAQDQRLLIAVQAIERARELYKSAHDKRPNDGLTATATGPKFSAQNPQERMT